MNIYQINSLKLFNLLRCLVGVLFLFFFNSFHCNGDFLFKLNIIWVIISSCILNKFNMDFFETIVYHCYWFVNEFLLLYFMVDCKKTIWYSFPIIDYSLFFVIMMTYIIMSYCRNKKQSIRNNDLKLPMLHNDLYNEL